MKSTKPSAALGLVAALALGIQSSRAQDGIKRTDLQTHDLSIPGREVVQQMVELQQSVVVARHTHPGEEVSVVLDGELLLEVAGKPAVTLKAGQAFTVPAGAAHGVKNTGSGPVKLLVTYIVEKGKPLRSPAPLAQNVPAPATITPRLETGQARVIVATLQPRTPSVAKDGHATNRVLIYLDDGVMTRKEGNQSTTIEFRRGDVRWRPASGAYIAENTSDHPIRILEIDLKGPPAGPAPATKLDPAMVDPKHYKVEFENEQVRVLRVHYEPHEKGATHEHILNRVVLYLNDQPGAKADDVRTAGAATHAEENASDRAADRIAVELK